MARRERPLRGFSLLCGLMAVAPMLLTGGKAAATPLFFGNAKAFPTPTTAVDLFANPCAILSISPSLSQQHTF